MKSTVYNPQKGRLETLEAEFIEENMTRFYSRGNGSVALIAGWKGLSAYQGGVQLSDLSV